jgi:hypothetical protein
MTSLEGETGDALVRRFAYMQRERLTMSGRKVTAVARHVGHRLGTQQVTVRFGIEPNRPLGGFTAVAQAQQGI